MRRPYDTEMPQLVLPDVRFHESFLASHREWAGATQDGAGIDGGEDFESATGFRTYVDGLIAQETTPLKEGFVTCTYRWIVEGDEYLGSISFRHELSDFLLNFGGHIGYGVRPSARRRGLASWALGETLATARERRYERVLITCRDDNAASAATIEKHGGLLEDIRTHDGVDMRRYWITI